MFEASQENTPPEWEHCQRAEVASVASGEKYKSLDSLLDAYRTEGIDSEGHFTLNPVRARELLEQFQLPEPAHYALHLISFLIGAGAQQLEIFSTRSQLRFEATGAEVEHATIASPFSVLLRGQTEPHLAELALGLNTILGQKGGEVALRYGKWKARYTPDAIEVEEARQEPTFTLICKPRCNEKCKDRELQLIDQAFRWAPIPIKVNGLSLPEPRSKETVRGLQILLQNPEHPLVVTPDATNRLTKPIQAPFSALIQIGKLRPEFRVIYLGREYPRALPWSFILPGWQVDITVVSDRFKKDLSQQAILENELFSNLVASLRAQLEHATELLLSHIPPFRGSDELVDDLVEHLFHSGKARQAIQFQKKLSEHLALSDGTFEKGKALYRLALLEGSQGRNSHQKLQLGANILSSVHVDDPLEPKWSMIKAEMAFLGGHDVEAEVEALVVRDETPVEILEHCFRWLIKLKSKDLGARAWHRFRLANCAFSAERLEEAQSQLELSEIDAAQFDDPDLLLRSVELKAKIAAQAGHLEKAMELFGRHLSMLRQTHGQYDLRLGLTLRRLVLLLQHAGQKKQAKEYLAWSKRLHA
jgi:tetratricopeptide (TPR) repeat protein